MFVARAAGAGHEIAARASNAIHSVDAEMGSVSPRSPRERTNDENDRLLFAQAKRRTRNLLSDKWFQFLIFISILCSSILAGAETYAGIRDSTLLMTVDMLVLLVFGIEVVLRLFCECPQIWNFLVGDRWISNCFDLLIVLLGIITLNQEVSSSSSISVLPILRLLRLTKLVNKIPQMRQILNGLAGGVSSAGYIITLLLLVLYIYAIVAMSALKNNNPWHYRNLPISLLSLFRAATLVDWSKIMYIDVFGCDKDEFVYSKARDTPELELYWHCLHSESSFLMAVLFWISFIVISALIMMSLFIGSITLSMSDSMQQMRLDKERAEKQRNYEKKVDILIHESKVTEFNTSIDRMASMQMLSNASSRVSVFLGLELTPMEKARAKSKLRRLLKLALGSSEVNDGSLDLEEFDGNAFRKIYWNLSKKARSLASQQYFNHCSTGMIVIAGIIVGLQSDDNVVEKFALHLQLADAIVLAAFTFELFIKIVAEGFFPMRFFFYWSRHEKEVKFSYWNIFDFSIVVGNYVILMAEHNGQSSTPSSSLLSMLRLVRLLKVFRLVRAFPELQVIVEALIMGLKSIGYIGGLLLLLIYVFAILGTTLFGSNDPFHFGSLHTSILTLFRVSTLDGWSDVMYINFYGCALMGYDSMPEQCTNSTPSYWVAGIYFVLFVTISSLVLLTLFVSVVTASMEEARTNQSKVRANDMRIKTLNLSDTALRNFQAAFNILDLDDSGFIDQDELRIGLQSVGCNPSQESLDNMMATADVDDSGTIDFAEFVVLMVNEHHLLEGQQERRPSNIAESEFSSLGDIDESVEQGEADREDGNENIEETNSPSHQTNNENANGRGIMKRNLQKKFSRVKIAPAMRFDD